MIGMRAFLAVAMILAALTAARADDPPLPATDRAAPTLTLTPALGWRLDAVVRMDIEGDTLVLLIEGDVINDGDSERPSPKVRFGLRDKESREFFHWTAQLAQPRIGPRDWLAFETRLERPPEDAYNVEIRTVDGD